MTGLFKNLPLFPEQASNFAPKVDNLFFALLGITGVTSALICAAILFFAVRYRKGSRRDRTPLTHRHQMIMEITWSGLPLLIFFGIFGWAAAVYQDIFTPPADATDVYVVGKQWMWKMQHPNGRREINELHLPVGRPVRLVMTSQDVIHSFFIPAFRTKMDVLPGRYTYSWFIATKPGTYHLFCAEYCGTWHSRMGGRIVAMEPTDFERWMEGTEGEGGSLAQRGEQLFTRLGCVTCHRDDSSARGPSLNGLYGSMVRLSDGRRLRADETYIRESILDPRAKVVAGFEPIMPTFKNQVSEDQIVELIGYIKAAAASAVPSVSPAAAARKVEEISGKPVPGGRQ